MRELEAESDTDFKKLLRMEPVMFRELFEKVCSRIMKEDTNYRKALEHGMKLVITLSHPATG